MSQKRIGLNAQAVGTRRGGAEKYAVTLGRCLIEAGHQLHVFAENVDAEDLPEEAFVHRVHPRRMPGLGWMKPYQFARASELAMRKCDLDLIIGFNKTWYQHVYLAVGGAHPASLEYSSRRFRSEWERALWWAGKAVNLKQWVFRLIADRQFRGQCRPHVIAPSMMSADHFHRYHGVPWDRITVVYNAVDRDVELPDTAGVRRAFRHRHGFGENDVAVLFAARNYSLKGIEPLLEAFAKAAAGQARAKLMVCGSRRDGRYRAQAKRLGIADRVLFLQFVDDIRECFAAADMFVFPTFYDPCSLVVLEAMASGLPVITTRQNGACELINPGIDGVVVDSPWAVGNFSYHMARLIHNDVLRRRMGAEARQHAKRFTIAARMKEIFSVLDLAAGGEAMPPDLRKVA